MTTFAVTLTGWLYGLALFRFKMLDFTPVARDMLLDEVGDGYLVFDPSGSLVDTNAVGRLVLDAEDTVLTEESVSQDRIRKLSGSVITIPKKDGDRSYELRSESVTDFREEESGTLLIIRDITEVEFVRRHEQRLSVMNRGLRHNIRNG